MNSIKNRSFDRNKVSWRYIKKIYVHYGSLYGTHVYGQFRILEPKGSNNEYALINSTYGYTTCCVRLISILKYSGTDIKKETLINLLKTEEGCNLVKKMIKLHVDELRIHKFVDTSSTLGYYNFPDNRIKWMRKNIISQTIV
jgi:hypothetical protein